MAVCATCGAEAPTAARFCPSCGATLAGGHETRKTVTVLFCDWVDSTPLGERLDPESLRAVQSAWYAEARAVLERHGGTLEKFIGDAVMAVFGIPQAREDDALRAVRAAAELREALARLNERLRAAHDVTLSIRTGVNTGEVVAGDPTYGQAFATGDAVVVAKRLEQAAAAGEILLGTETRGLVRDAAIVEPVEGLELKGKAKPASAWRLLGVVAGAAGFERRLDSELVGRALELEVLRHAFARARADGTGQVLTILGAAGVGKSRLVQELLDGLGADATVLRGRCLPYGDGITFWPLGDVVRAAAGIDRGVRPEIARAKIGDLLADDPEAERVVERLAAVLGLDERPVPTEEAFWATRRLLEALGRARPVVVAFDDLHWAEATFLDLVEYLGDHTRDAPIVLICLARPELLDARPTWGGGKVNASTMLVEPLSLEESETLIGNLLGDVEADAETRRAIAEVAEGNPLFVEEILAMLLEDGALRPAMVWRADGLASIRVPPTIQALLTARLDRLEEREQAVAEAAAVMGTAFRRIGLEELVPEPDVGEQLRSLVRKELIRPDRSLPAPAFRFRHVLIREAAYARVPKERRAELHERFAAWLEREYAGRLGELEEIVAYHLEQAHKARRELGRTDDAAVGARAAELLGRAGRRALARGDAPAAASLLRRASTLPATQRERLIVLLDLVSALREAGDLSGAAATVEEARNAADEVGERGLAARTLLETFYLLFFTDPERWMADAVPTAEAAIRILEEEGDDAGLSVAWTQLLLLHYARCRIRAMEEAAAQALAAARRSGDRRQVSMVLNLLARGALVGPTPVEQAIARCAEIAEEGGGDRILEAVTLCVRGCLEAMRGRFDAARSLVEESRAILADLGQSRLVATVRTYAGKVALLAGDAEAAERELRQSLDALRQIGDLGNVATTAATLAAVLEELGRDSEALELTLLSERTAAPDDLHSVVLWHATRARVKARTGELDEALRLAEAAVASATPTDNLVLQGDALCALAIVLSARGLAEQAEQAAHDAAARYGAKGNVVAAARAQELVPAAVRS
jgi:class 3 adenylate cyclase/tetratricopeptide (TPR) repeat protein